MRDKPIDKITDKYEIASFPELFTYFKGQELIIRGGYLNKKINNLKKYNLSIKKVK